MKDEDIQTIQALIEVIKGYLSNLSPEDIELLNLEVEGNSLINRILELQLDMGKLLIRELGETK